MSLTKSYGKQMNLFNNKKQVSNKIQLSPKIPIEERKRIVILGIHYDKLFDIIEKKTI